MAIEEVSFGSDIVVVVVSGSRGKTWVMRCERWSYQTDKC
jgi:hypothetical protein